ncbi:unnamed protein product [marine sediment metagenome]|uniref:Radical SAM core domain-containing protein n=1 Tax=marine sediment metagenome TaxID=412755 RepID=X0T0A0_9ZZZZ
MKKHNSEIPPVIIYSITGKCNLCCKGCYAGGFEKDKVLKPDEIRKLIKQAEGLGISYFFIAGGEPLMYDGILELIAEFRDIIFLVFTNGTLIDEKTIKIFKKNYNLIPIMSFEGDMENTDIKRGKGIYEKVMKKVNDLNNNRILTGFSVTVDRRNRKHIASEDFFKDIRKKFSFGILVAYQPLNEKEDSSNALSIAEYNNLCDEIDILAGKYSFSLLNFPGDEEKWGGCMSSGKGFIHINSNGDVEPCPFAGISAGSVKDKNLINILKTPYLKSIRDNKDQFRKIENGSCLLANNLDILKELKENLADNGK